MTDELNYTAREIQSNLDRINTDLRSYSIQVDKLKRELLFFEQKERELRIVAEEKAV